VILPAATLALFALVIPFRRADRTVGTGDSRSAQGPRDRTGAPPGEPGLRAWATKKISVMGPVARAAWPSVGAPGTSGVRPEAAGNVPNGDPPPDEGGWAGFLQEVELRPRENGGLRVRGLGETSFSRAQGLKGGELPPGR
jgi:hypothetical protein